jgi:hypothetical protein
VSQGPVSVNTRAVVSPQLKPQGGYQVSIPAGSNAVVIELNGTEVLRISLGATMSIKSQNDLSFEAPNIKLIADKTVTIQTGTDFWLKSGANMSFKSSSDMSLKCSSMMSLNSGSTMDLKGSTVNVN